jgi:acetylornithine/succinyldiaminopimelate/putrescine aminotransferase
MLRDVRGLGLLTGIEFGAPRGLRLRIPFEAFARVHPAMFGQVLVMHLFNDTAVFGQICGNHFMVLKATPPLVVTEAQLASYVDAVGTVADAMHGSLRYWNEALGMAARVLHVV